MRRLVAAFGVAAAAALLVCPAAPAAADPTPSPALASDAVGPLFPAAQLRPGQAVARCVELTWSDAPGSALRLSADVTGALAPYLDVLVDVGTGGGYATCEGFDPTRQAWSGTMAALRDTHPDGSAALPLVRPTTTAGTVTVRLTVTVRDTNAAQARTAGGSFRFRLEAAPSPTTPPTTPPAEPPTPEPPAPEPTPEPTAEPPAPEDPGPQEPDVPPDPRDPLPPGPTATPDPEPTDGVTAPPTDDATAGPDDDDPSTVTVPLVPGEDGAGGGGWLAETVTDVGRRLREVADTVREQVEASAAPVARAVGWTFWTAPVLVLFLLLQNRIDRSDPKLAEAPAEAAPSLPFDDTYPDHPGTPRTPGGQP